MQLGRLERLDPRERLGARRQRHGAAAARARGHAGRCPRIEIEFTRAEHPVGSRLRRGSTSSSRGSSTAKSGCGAISAVVDVVHAEAANSFRTPRSPGEDDLQ
jgi:hypothetical protein